MVFRIILNRVREREREREREIKRGKEKKKKGSHRQYKSSNTYATYDEPMHIHRKDMMSGIKEAKPSITPTQNSASCKNS